MEKKTVNEKKKQLKKKTIIEKSGQQIHEFSIEFQKQKFDYKIQEPTFDQIAVALTESMATTGKLNMGGGGKVIFELCCLEYDAEIEKIPSLLLSVCLDLYDRYVMPVETTIKKK
jgi:hypothetical protein